MPAAPTPLHLSRRSPRGAQPDERAERDGRQLDDAATVPEAARGRLLALANGRDGYQEPLRRDGPVFVQQYREDDGALREEVIAGLGRRQASLSPKLFYDVLGSRLFEAITALDEYYPTRTEASIFRTCAVPIAARAGSGCVLVDLGAGNCQKAAGLFASLRPAQYVALDISVEFLRDTLDCLQQQYPQIPMLGLGADLCGELVLPEEVARGRRLFFYPGSSIGNFAPEAAVALLRRLRAQARAGDGLLIGVDLVKDEEVLCAAYDDALGVTAAFNRNVLRHVNGILGSDFALPDWRHVAGFERGGSRIQMHLEAVRDLTVRWAGGARSFAAGERIHTEDSYKFQPEAFARMLESAGFQDPVCWTDARGWFAVFHARA
ncbi:dimethylhistidine N-methyltransferase [Cupriavidus sp. USMAHM13]|uniref:L-histidine N(alpha)-methyltransferase n=1 Tax=Cupriavidus sp. USMAHM13 TaxID=1389192 RepID=UPI0008A698E3|nr:L-histidine N(alpha)-methyltransferase [Cupriavidus sp. USMAHM13]AOZ00430.1 dimethylhistidine N-methyltransferase [Cupriavidus sp. USMAHM13]